MSRYAMNNPEGDSMSQMYESYIDKADHDRKADKEQGYRIFVNANRTVYVRLWASGLLETASRGAAWETWGPPVTLTEERGE